MKKYFGEESMISPTGKNLIREDDVHGSGAFASGRGGRAHYGEDYIIDPGRPIFMPHDGIIKRMITVYVDEPEWKGLEIVGNNVISRLFYVFPIVPLIGKEVKSGERIGYSQDISKKYKGITPHIHWEIYIKPSLLLGK